MDDGKKKVVPDNGIVIGKYDEQIASIPSPIDHPRVKIDPKSQRDSAIINVPQPKPKILN